jgi:hypothetical protein
VNITRSSCDNLICNSTRPPTSLGALSHIKTGRKNLHGCNHWLKNPDHAGRLLPLSYQKIISYQSDQSRPAPALHLAASQVTSSQLLVRQGFSRTRCEWSKDQVKALRGLVQQHEALPGTVARCGHSASARERRILPMQTMKTLPILRAHKAWLEPCCLLLRSSFGVDLHDAFPKCTQLPQEGQY